MKTVLILAAIAFAPPVAGAELRFQCPERYLSRPADLAEVPQGWQGAVATVQPELLVSGGGVVGGPPKLHPPAELHGNTVRITGGWSETRYPVGQDGQSWAFCAYGRGGEVQLYRRVDGQGRSTCAVRSSLPKSVQALKVEIACR